MDARRPLTLVRMHMYTYGCVPSTQSYDVINFAPRYCVSTPCNAFFLTVFNVTTSLLFKIVCPVQWLHRFKNCWSKGRGPSSWWGACYSLRIRLKPTSEAIRLPPVIKHQVTVPKCGNGLLLTILTKTTIIWLMTYMSYRSKCFRHKLPYAEMDYLKVRLHTSDYGDKSDRFIPIEMLRWSVNSNLQPSALIVRIYLSSSVLEWWIHAVRLVYLYDSITYVQIYVYYL